MRLIGIAGCVGAVLAFVAYLTRPRPTVSSGYYEATNPRHRDAEFVLIEDGYLFSGW